MTGALTFDDYKILLSNNNLQGNSNILNQIQPSSIDLTLSEECYEIKISFLSSRTRLRDKLSDMVINKIDLSKKKIFKINTTYIVRLNEKLI